MAQFPFTLAGPGWEGVLQFPRPHRSSHRFRNSLEEAEERNLPRIAKLSNGSPGEADDQDIL